MKAKKTSKSLCELKQTETYEKTLPSLQKLKIYGPPKTPAGEKKNPLNPQTLRYGYNELTLKKIIQINENYLTDKVKIDEVMRPSRYDHKMPSTTGHSEYNRKFNSSRKPINITESNPKRNIQGNICKPESQINGFKSTYHADYRLKTEEELKHLSKKQRYAIKKYQKHQAPTFTETSYNRDYHSIVGLPYSKAQCPDMNLVQFGKFSGDSTYRQYFKHSLGTPQSSPKQIIQKDNTIFVSIKNHRNSSYQQAFKISDTPIAVQKSCKPDIKYNPHQPKMKATTEYSETFVEQTPFRRKQFQCLNNADLKSFVMTILND